MSVPPEQKKVFKTFDEVKTALTNPQTTRPPQQENDKEPCPRCGGLKFKTATFVENGGEKKTVSVLICGACTAEYKKYRDEVLAANIKLAATNPSAPEPAGAAGKFQWVLAQLDLVKFKAEAEAAEAAYRAKYNEVVVQVLNQRGYLNGTPEWKGTGTTRPVMRFTQTAFNSGMGSGVRTALEEGLKDLRWQMKKTTGRLEAATRIKAELEAKLAAPPPPAETPATPPATKPKKEKK